MSLQVEKLERNMARLTIEVPAAELEKAIQNAYVKSKGKFSISGFRKGKVPRSLIEKIYGKEIFYEDAANELIPDAYEKAVEDCTEDIVSSPEIQVTQIEAGKPFIFTAKVALKPEVKLGKYKGVKIKKLENIPTEEEVEAAINQERETNARNVVVEDRPVKDGDMVILDFEGFVDGVAFEGGKKEDYFLTIGSGVLVPGFEEQLIGAEIGKEIEVNVIYPEDYQSEELAGKAAVFQCVVKEIKEKELPELDDEFAEEVSEFDTLAEYKEDVKAKLTRDKEKINQEVKEEAVMDAIIADSDMEIPEAMLETQQKQIAEEFSKRIQTQGFDLDHYFQLTGLTYPRFIEQIKPQAERRIRSRLVLEAVVAAEKIEASEEDYEAEIDKMAEAYKMEADKVKEMMGEQGKEQVMRDLAVQKAVDFVVANAKEK